MSTRVRTDYTPLKEPDDDVRMDQGPHDSQLKVRYSIIADRVITGTAALIALAGLGYGIYRAVTSEESWWTVGGFAGMGGISLYGLIRACQHPSKEAADSNELQELNERIQRVAQKIKKENGASELLINSDVEYRTSIEHQLGFIEQWIQDHSDVELTHVDGAASAPSSQQAEEIMRLKEQVESLKESLKSAREQIRDAVDGAASAHSSEHAAELMSLRGQVEKLNKVLERARLQTREAEKARDENDVKISELEDELRTAREQTEEAQRDCDELRGQIKQQDGVIAAIEQANEGLKDAIERLTQNSMDSEALARAKGISNKINESLTSHKDSFSLSRSSLSNSRRISGAPALSPVSETKDNSGSTLFSDDDEK